VGVDVAGAHEGADTKVTNVDLQLIRLEDLNSGQHTNTNTSTAALAQSRKLPMSTSSYSNAEAYVEPEHEHDQNCAVQ
jgi:hypothetical protein